MYKLYVVISLVVSLLLLGLLQLRVVSGEWGVLFYVLLVFSIMIHGFISYLWGANCVEYNKETEEEDDYDTAHMSALDVDKYNYVAYFEHDSGDVKENLYKGFDNLDEALRFITLINKQKHRYAHGLRDNTNTFDINYNAVSDSITIKRLERNS